MGHDFGHIQRAVLSTPWAIDPDSLAWAAIVDVVTLRADGGTLSLEDISARIEAARNGPRSGGGRQVGVAVLPIYGVISARQNLMAQTSGGTSAEAIAADFRAAMASSEVDAIVLDIDSPGGAVDGIEELAAEIRAARGQKPIVAVANHTAASAAYWIASAADEIVASPSAVVGSIGVFTAHDDMTEAQAKLGVKRSVISAGKHKAEGALGQPLSEEARAHVQEQVDQFYTMMVGAIAKGRNTTAKNVEKSYGQGRTLLAKPALEAGVVDRVDTLEATIQRVARQAARRPTAYAVNGSTQTVTTTGSWPDSDPLAALDSEPTFASRLSLVSVAARDLATHARERAEMRAREDRTITASDRAGLLAVADSLREVAEASPVEADPTPDWKPRARLALEMVQAEYDITITTGVPTA